MFSGRRNYRNSHFADVGGLPTGELNRLELDLLFLMGFKLHVGVSVSESYSRHLEREVSLGVGYQIERALGFVCGGDITSKDRGRAELNQSAHVYSDDPPTRRPTPWAPLVCKHCQGTMYRFLRFSFGHIHVDVPNTAEEHPSLLE